MALLIIDEHNFQTKIDEIKFTNPFLKELFIRESACFVSNLKTKIAALQCDDLMCLLTINEAEYENALICSPYTTYITYALDELKKFGKPWIKLLMLFYTGIMSIVFRLTQFNRVVQVNNNLNSLIKHPLLFSSLLPEITAALIKKYPSHAILFFRVNETLDAAFLAELKKNKYDTFPDRAAHIFLPEKKFLQRSHSKRDLSLLRNTSYTVVLHEALTAQDAERLADLYRLLFIDKHSTCNPIYTADYFQQAIKHHWHHYTALRNSAGQIDAFISWFESEKIMLCGPLGYDSEVDRKMGLYRQLVALCLQYANEHQFIFNMGGGSDEFKLNRGSTQVLEYTAIYYKHLPWYRRIPWKILSFACNKLLKKIVDESHL
ncbi:MAG: hypothetical protein COY58_08300 [Gammaproteobacteria bacterium CG_4_10_14_0_8_um_filter_38_16]|nr:MAG: hypothetical protein COY58_08300 [Gammaproteobacteria bacterium CG_4_10_14_0_8_um_filter_38_16]PJA03717.1 MAG: hypothetical protein COX72_03610 [Gammaproteobacteria bacterium CG_4_10_14_0_2_um_filter_38_22]PJB09920.1 MAG: hypothetical protein CO120_07625 [Gammaproteobacteria bacterium CG_4_9_14_3_um_filter_38_9]